jgi:glycosyltransferase involved in cell wall biosynthesis
MPQISIIIPAYNQAKYLPDAINSIIDQSFEDWECIIVNDGSSDNTREVVNPYLGNRKFIYIEQHNNGLAATRNRGINESSGRYIQFLDADDVIDHTKLKKQFSILSKHKDPALSYTDYFSSTEYDLKRPYPEGRYLPPIFLMDDKIHDLILRWETEMSIPIHCFLFDVRLFKDYGIRFDETLPNHEDWDCWMNIFRLNPSIYYIPEKLSTYRIHTDSMVYNWKLMESGYMKALLKQRSTFERRSNEYELLSKKIRLTKKKYKMKRPSTISKIVSWIQKKLHHFVSC